MSRTLFISDLHLHASRPAVTQGLDTFLAREGDCVALYILGDLFEAWPGDDDDSSLAVRVRSCLRRFSAQGPALFIMVGNRDFLLGEAFCRSVGATLLSDPSRIDLYGTQTLLMHGDSLCTADRDYQSFRSTVRDPNWQADILNQDLQQRRELAARLRLASSAAKSNKAEDIMDVTPSEVDRVMREHGAGQLIHGHTHRPGSHSSIHGKRWVLGDWSDKGWFLEAKMQSIELIDFVI